jgi:hypothetical protein
MKYLVLTVLLLTGCSTKSGLEEKREYANICNGTNVQSIVEEDREVTCYPQAFVRVQK